MKILPMPLVNTPPNWDALQEWIDRHPAHDGMRARLTIVAIMAWNLAAKVQAMPEPDEEEK